MSNKNQSSIIGGLATLIVAAVFIWYFFGGGMERHVKQTMEQVNREAQVSMERIHRQVATDAVKQYEIAKRSGTAIDAYVHAGLVAAAYLQAKDEINYQKWKRIEASEARTAGVPNP